ncbi:CLUMA_CG010302, isoform A [Clunio marinus]|uniref:CLUMA_CG010302, isoform A n=1 Tax=Clunio marinus TaxID=568069 RepID=A0A1J1I9F4_9DIPT|nr:CLUMA_CG010302, isoform A [Clunio marinus]
MSQKRQRADGEFNLKEANSIETSDKNVDFYESYFLNLVQFSNSELDAIIEEKKSHNAALKAQNKELKEKSEQLDLEKAELVSCLFKENVYNEKTKETFNEWSKSLMAFQSKYNDLVDPFNDAKNALNKTRDEYKNAVSMYNDREQKITDYQKELDEKLIQKAEEVEAAQVTADQTRRSRDAAALELEEQKKLLDQAKEEVQRMNEELNKFNIEDLLLRADQLVIERQMKNDSITELQTRRHQQENEVRESEMKQNAIQCDIQSLENEIDETKNQNYILERRLESLKEISEKIIQTNFERQIRKVESGNFRLVEELDKKIHKTNENLEIIDKLMMEKREIQNKIQGLEISKLQKLNRIEELAYQIADIPTENKTLLDQRVKSLNQINETKTKIDSVNQEMKKIHQHYEKKISKEHRRQALMGFIDSDKKSSQSGKSSDESEKSMTKVSEEVAEIGLIKKINFDSSFSSSVN